MDLSKFTQKSREILGSLEKIAYDFGNQEIVQEHLLYGMMTIEDSLLARLIQIMGIEPAVFLAQTEGLIKKRPKVEGGQVYVGSELNKVLVYAENEAKAMGDEYISVEHLFLSLLQKPSYDVKKLLREFQIDRERFLQALSKVRGNQKVTSDNPEAVYESLEKYGYDLVQRAAKARPGHWQRCGNTEYGAYFVPQDKKQPGAYRRTRRGENSGGRRACPAYCPGRCAGGVKGQAGVCAGYGIVNCRSQVPGRI